MIRYKLELQFHTTNFKQEEIDVNLAARIL